jgi:aspartate/methionine/tyrosine aminotransferase
VVFSKRVPELLAPNRLARTIEALREERRPIIDLTESNPTRAAFEYPEGILAGLSDSRALVYRPEPFGLMESRRAIAADYARRGQPVAPERVVLTSSTSEAYSVLFKLLCDPGDEVLAPRPSYPLFEHLTRLDGVTIRPYDLEYHGAWSTDFGSVERAWSARTRAVLVVTPNNPTGSFVKPDELGRLARLCASRRAALVADEVFADYPLGEVPAKGRANVLALEDVLAFSLGGLSKSTGLPQVKLAWLAVAGRAGDVEAALMRLELICDTYLSVSTPVQLAAERLLSSGAAVRRQIQLRIGANHRHLARCLDEAPALELLRAEAGWYAVLRVPSLTSEEDLVTALLTSSGVLTHPGYFFDFPAGSYLVLSLLPPEPVFAEGVARLLRHFDCTVARR